MAVAKRTAIKIITTVVVLAIVGVAAYFYFPKIFGDILYPIEYEDLIVKYSKQFAMDPALVAGIIYTESHFSPAASSGVGAQGLMQIMPATGQAIAGRLGEPFGDLLDPDTNIRYGTSYIRSLIDAYGGDVDAALAAYNGGSGTADRYVISRSDASLPDETAAYIKKVNSAWQIYEQLYGNVLNASNVAEALKIKQEEQEKSWWDKMLERVGITKNK